MKAYVDLTLDKTIALGRIVKALKEYAPSSIEIVNDRNEADLIVVHVNGRRDRVQNEIDDILSKGKSYAIIQYCLRSTLTQSTSDWLYIWENAKLVWSYYNLNNELKRDNIKINFNFYHSPLGVDSNIFYPLNIEKKYLICTSGLSYLTESVRECIKAAQAVGGKVAHLGSDLKRSDVTCFTNLSDSEVNKLYNQCWFVSGLRRHEGFELPAAEGLLAGAIPILYDREHYTDWYHGLGKFIPETNRGEIIEDLVTLFKENINEIVPDWAISEGKKRFNWEKIIPSFWNLCHG